MTERFVQPRRFSELFQVSEDWPGSIPQQQVLRKAFKVDHGSRQHLLLQRLDRNNNQVYKRSYLPLGFLPDDMWPFGMLAVAGATGINFRASFHPDYLASQARHELGHVVDKQLLSAADRFYFMLEANIDPNQNTWTFNVQEVWADAFRDWWHGTSWASLTTLLLPP